MAKEQMKPLAQVKTEVREKVKKEYEAFLDGYKKLPEEERFAMMVKDAGKIDFYRHIYIIIVIIGDLDPDEWRRLNVYYFDTNILEDHYKAFKAFEADFAEEIDADEHPRNQLEGFDPDFINAYINGASVFASCCARA